MFLDLLRRERLANIAASPVGQGLHHMRLAAFRCNHHYGHVFGVRYSRKLFDELQPIHHRHLDVAKDQIDRVFLESGDRLSSIPSLEYLGQVDACLAQRPLHDLSHDRGIVDNQSSYGHKSCSHSSGGGPGGFSIFTSLLDISAWGNRTLGYWRNTAICKGAQGYKPA